MKAASSVEDRALKAAGFTTVDLDALASRSTKKSWVADGYSIGPSKQNLAVLRARYGKD